MCGKSNKKTGGGKFRETFLSLKNGSSGQTPFLGSQNIVLTAVVRLAMGVVVRKRQFLNLFLQERTQFF
jgi:hypothetical protein